MYKLNNWGGLERVTMGDDEVKAEALQILSLCNALPLLLVFDLDYTLWPFYCECRSARDKPSLYPQARGILNALKEKNISMAIASRTPTPATARAFLDKLGITSFFAAMEIFPSSTHKTEHFRKIQQKTGVPYKSMLFFDDENRNIEAVSQMGVTSIWVGNGVNLEALRIAVQPTWMVRWLQEWVPSVLYIKNTKKHVVALTFDDGPHKGITEEILDILKENDCRATFFIIGSNMDNFPDLVQRIVGGGHEVGNHTMYDVASWSLPLDVFEKQLLEVDDRLKSYYFTDATKMPIKWFRPGHGFYTQKMIQVAQAHGYRTALGSLFPLDTLFSNMGKYIAKYLLWKIHDGAIIILHDREPQAKQTPEVLKNLLPELKAQGYSVVSLSELLELKS